MAEPTPVNKAVHVFAKSEDTREQERFGTHYAFAHNLGTSDILVSGRSETGQPIPVSSSSQDDNIAVVSRKDSYSWNAGDRILVLG